MSVRISLTLEANEMFLSLHMIFSLERASVVWAILERISGFDPSLEMIDHLFGKELFIRFSASAFRKLPSIYEFSYFPFGFEGRLWDLSVSVPDHCLSFYFAPRYLKFSTSSEL